MTMYKEPTLIETADLSEGCGHITKRIAQISWKDITLNYDRTNTHKSREVKDNSNAFHSMPPVPPYVQRLRILWAKLREPVIDCFPLPPKKAGHPERYLSSVESILTTDAYHSLLIEGYQVSEELIERIESGNWTPDSTCSNNDLRNAMAAKGYLLAAREVKSSLRRILTGENPGLVVEEDHGTWFDTMLAPEVQAGLLCKSDLSGYRSASVRIRNSRHIPPRSEAVWDLIPAFFDLLKNEENPSVRSVLGHFIFVYIHPYIDGNGRIGRFILNAMMASGGYPWVVIPFNRRKDYLSSLEEASVSENIEPFAGLLSELLETSLK